MVVLSAGLKTMAFLQFIIAFIRGVLNKHRKIKTFQVEGYYHYSLCYVLSD